MESLLPFLPLLLLLIPSVREKFKKSLKWFYIATGVSLLVTLLIMDFGVYPKLNELGVDANLPMLIVSNILALAIFIIGIRLKISPATSNKFYFWMFALLVILVYSALLLMVISVISPIYQFSSEFTK